MKLYKIYKNIYIILLIFATVIFSYALNVKLRTYPIDGTFQTASVLFRILNNQVLSLDYLSYLNVGMSYLLYPIFFIFGGSYFSTILSTNLLIFLVLTLFLYVIYSLNLKSETRIGATSFYSSFVIYSMLQFTEVFKLGTNYLKYYTNIDLDFFLLFVTSGASLRTIRMSPVLFFAIFFLNWKKSEFTKKYALNIISLFNSFLIITWPLDYGLITAFFSTIFAYYIVFQKNISSSFKLVILTIINSTIFLFLLTKGSPLNFIKFQYFDIPNYQSWYFAPFDSAGLLNTLNTEKVLLSIFLSFILLKLYKGSKSFYIYLFVSGTLFFGGLLPTLFGHPGNYFYFFKIFIYLNVFLIFLSFLDIELYLYKISKFISIPVLFSIIIFSVTYVIYLDSESINTSKRYDVTFDISRIINFYNDETVYKGSSPGKFIFDESLNGYIDFIYEDLFRINNELIYEEYFGIYSAKFNISPELKVDSIIHTYSDERKILRNMLIEKPYTVISNYNHTFFEWGISFNWWFYEILLLKYEPSKFIDTSSKTSNVLSSKLTPSGIVIWNQKSASKEINPVWLQCYIENNFLILPEVAAGLYSVRVEKSLGKVVTVNNKFKIPAKILDYTLDTNLDPNYQNVSFPIMVHEEDSYEIKVKNNIDVITSCKYTQILTKTSSVYEQLDFENIGKDSS